MNKIYNEITNYLDILLDEDFHNSIFYRNFILKISKTLYYIRGLIIGRFILNEDGTIIKFNIDYNRIIKIQSEYYILESKELEKLLTERFVGKKLADL